MKDAVFSWRISSRLKAELEREARARGISTSSLLEQAATDLLEKSRHSGDEDAEQRRLHADARKYFGVLDLGRSDLSENASAEVRKRLKKQYAR